MRVVIDGRRLNDRRTGVGRYLESLLIEWRDQFANEDPPWDQARIVAADQTIWSTAATPFPARCEAQVIGEGWPGLAWEIFGLGRILQKDNLLFAPANLVPPTWRGRTVLVLHDLIQEAIPNAFPWRTRAWFGWRYRLAAQRAEIILTPSEATANDIERFYRIPRRKIMAIPPGIDPEFLPISADSPQSRDVRRLLGLNGQPYFLFVGKRSRRRHVREILEAFAMLRKDPGFAHYRLVFVGSSEPILQEHVIVAGHWPDSLMPSLYSQAEALIYPSDYEGFGLPIAEAMACGCPVVTCRNSALQESAGEAAIFLSEPSSLAIRDAMRTLIEDSSLRQDRRNAGLSQVATFSRSRFARQVADVLRSMR